MIKRYIHRNKFLKEQGQLEVLELEANKPKKNLIINTVNKDVCLNNMARI